MASILHLITVGNKRIFEVDADPAAGGGTDAPIGTLASYSDGTNGFFYLKTGSANTDWQEFQPLDDDLTTIASLTHTDGNVIRSNGTNWESTTVDLDDLGDVNISGLASGEVITYDGTEWVNAALGTLSIALDDLTDVEITSVASGNILYYDGTNFVNEAPGSASGVQAWDNDLDDIAALTHADGNFIVSDGTDWTVESGATARASLGLTIGTDVQAWDDDLDDIAGLAHADGNFIVSDGTNWVVESGNVARTSLGLGTGDDVTFNSLDLTVDLTVPTINRGTAGGVSLFTDAGANTITMGSATSTVVVQGDLTVNGTTTTINTNELLVEDKRVTLNDGGAADSGNGAGIEIEEGGSITGYFQTEAATPTTDAWLLKAPDSFEATLDLSSLTQDRSYTFPDASGTIALVGGSGTFTPGQVVYVDASGQLITEDGTSANSLEWDGTNNRLGIATTSPSETLEVAGNTKVSGSGSEIILEADSSFRITQATVNTTDNTDTTIQTIAIPTDTCALIEARVVGRRTGGTAGTIGDSATYIGTIRAKNVGGTVTIHDKQSDYTSEDQTSWRFNAIVSGTDVLIQVRGATDNNVTWETTTKIQVV